jgi:glutamate racemase
MYKRYNPDIILIACNTLSVIYDQTEFAQITKIPVVGIVDFGVDMIKEKLDSDSEGIAIIMGTPTTIGQNTHKEKLVAAGIAADRIFTQGCDMLESEIQSDPSSDMVKTMIEMYAMEAWDKAGEEAGGNIYVGLCCTHYSYAFDSFKEVFDNVTGKNVAVLDPNRSMSAFLIDSDYAGRYDSTVIATEVISRAVISDDAVESISRMIAPVSPSFADALENYIHDTTLFEIGE